MGIGYCVRAGIFGASLVSGLSFAGSHHHHDGDQKIYRFNLKDYQTDMRVIAKLGFDVAGVNLSEKTVDLVLSAHADHHEYGKSEVGPPADECPNICA